MRRTSGLPGPPLYWRRTSAENIDKFVWRILNFLDEAKLWRDVVDLVGHRTILHRRVPIPIYPGYFASLRFGQRLIPTVSELLAPTSSHSGCSFGRHHVGFLCVQVSSDSEHHEFQWHARCVLELMLFAKAYRHGIALVYRGRF